MLYKLTSSYTQLQSIDFKRRELFLKEDAHKFKYYIPSQESDPTTPSSYPNTETYTPGPTNIHYPGKPVVPEPVITTTYESLTPAQRTFCPSLNASNFNTPSPTQPQNNPPPLPPKKLNPQTIVSKSANSSPKV